MKHQISTEDIQFRQEFESCKTPTSDFNHQAHIRLAYIYLSEHDDATSYEKMKSSLQNFLAHHNVDPSKYHETVTQAWILAVRHFMEKSDQSDNATESATDFIDKNPRLLEEDIMLTHYTKEKLFSDEARLAYIEPDLDPIPRYA